MKPDWWRPLLFARLLSPQGLLVRAAAIAVIFLVLHVCGLREYTTILTGTPTAGGTVNHLSAFLALFYMVFHLGTVVVAPVVVLAALGWAGWNLWQDGRFSRRSLGEGGPQEEGSP